MCGGRKQRKQEGGIRAESLKGKEAPLRYRLQLAAFRRAGRGEVARARAVQWLRGMAATAGIMLSQEKGGVGRVVQEVGGTLHNPRMDGDIIRAFFERCRRMESAEVLELITREGVPAKDGAGGNLKSEVKYENHRSTAKNRREEPRKAGTDVAWTGLSYSQ